MKRITIFLVILSLNLFSMTATEILKKVDYNMTPTTVKYDGRMIINQGKQVLTKEMKVIAEGAERALIEFTSPPRDRGTKFLRTEDNLYIFFPSAGKTQKLSGHMLRQGMMGSDLSYEDQTSRNKLEELYNTKLLEETKDTYILELVSKPGKNNTYHKRILEIYKETFVLKSSLMYATSGKLLKELTVLEYRKIGDRYYITNFRMDDKIKKDSFTQIISTNIEVDIKIDPSTFTLSNLEKRN